MSLWIISIAQIGAGMIKNLGDRAKEAIKPLREAHKIPDTCVGSAQSP